MIENELGALGLDEKEQRFYLAALERGASSVTELSIKAGVTRTHGYDLLERLASRGLLRTIAGAGGQRVVAEDPEVLLSRWEQTKGALDVLVPRLRALTREGRNKTLVRQYEGRAEVARAVAAAAQSGSGPTCLVAAAIDGSTAFSEKDILSFVGKMQQGGRVLMLIVASHMRDRLAALDVTESTASVRFLAEGVHLPVVLIINGERSTYVASDAERYAHVIESRDMAQTNRAMFDCLWQSALPGLDGKQGD